MKDKIEFVGRAIEAGYFIRIFFISTGNPTINSARIAKRVMEGGHDVPITKIISRYVKSIANCAEIAVQRNLNLKDSYKRAEDVIDVLKKLDIQIKRKIS